ncbi:extracellular elastinolytic metalloproteinase [Uncinocarpus reesii 1704]|uniref:Extracellular metalloproteinase 9 n=1 Tax=Uncinocarpus reesii (strain UAMH 1704) TaxID=336963 RepID=MEP9_UNCRE|nr:extracellular elastinolytic metalloproteinase [Uncinocarpus reesii 1704]C4JR56.1 RecName: Full=Extracellular metalloproteinase 9; AltName: Full=Elastinolytic metalloproteinase MEP9; AltName: Full=Fungalysin MEP9; Flags: Precursor [Uncinocarpus reesii 1704]EEP78692.1 extracellular elastinolytic metalloproteinase [Uncinocarpus reesii 1704]
MHGLLLAAGLLTLPLRALAHPGHQSTSILSRRGAVDLDAYRVSAKAEYSNVNDVAENPPAVSLMSSGSYVDIATELVKTTLPGVTFRVVNDHYVGTNGVAHVHFRQTIHGVDVDNADFNVNVKDGKVFSFGNGFYKGEIPKENPMVKRDFSDPVHALKGACNALKIPIKTNKVSVKSGKGQESVVFKGTSGALSEPKGDLVYFVKPDGKLSLTWRVETDVGDNWLSSYVDAKDSSKIHGVTDYVADATFQVYPWGLNDPTEGSRQTLTDPWERNASEFTWHSDGNTRYPTTRGNNGIAQDNPSGGTGYLNNYRPQSSALRFEYPYSTSMSPPTSYKDASITQLFYTANTFHDLTYLLGFTERAGNFEVNNNNQGGRGNDFVILNAQDGSGVNNANFATPPDGQPGRMRMYTWNRSQPNRDGCFEAGIVIHEYAHGLSNRLCGGPANSRCLSALESGGMGEGWGDFLATAIRLKANDTRRTSYTMGEWASNQRGGIRQYPYSTSTTTNPLVYTTVNRYNRVHDIGTVWATMLYEVLWNLIDKHGKNDGPRPEFRNGVPTDGKYLTMKLVIDGMALMPCNPNFVQARDAIIDADEALTGGQNKCEIWAGFAKRQLGTGARYGRTNRVGSTEVPSECR